MAVGWSLLVPRDARRFRGLGVASCGYAAFLVAFWAAVSAALARLKPGEEKVLGVRRGTLALKLANLLHHAFVGPLAVLALLKDPVLRSALRGDAASAALLLRDPSGPPAAVLALTPVTLGYLTADLLLLPQWNLLGAAPSDTALMVFHHAMSMVAWPFAIKYDYCARYVLVMLSYELSSVFLTANWLLSASGLKNSLLYGMSGGLFTLSFLLIRIVGALPQFLALARAPPWRAAREAYPGVLGWMFPWSAVLVLPHVLNFFWAAKVSRGAVKLALGGAKKTAGRRDAETTPANQEDRGSEAPRT